MTCQSPPKEIGDSTIPNSKIIDQLASKLDLKIKKSAKTEDLELSLAIEVAGELAKRLITCDAELPVR